MTEHRISLDSIAANSNGHSLFAPSSSKMWLTCSGSLVANALAPDSAGEAAAEGTVAHAVAEEWLKSGARPDHLLGTVERIVEGDQVFEITIDEEMLGYVEMYVSWCEFLPGKHYIEQRVDFSDLTPIEKQGGTADHIALTLHRVVVSDLKYGVGVKVYAENNTQACLYAYGVFREWDFLYDIQEIEIRICQPRLDHFDTWTITRQQLLDFAEYAKERAHAAWCTDAPRTPGDEQCQFCRVKQDCAAFAVMAERLTDGVFEDLGADVSAEDMTRLKERLDSGEYDLRPVSVAELSVAQKVAVFKHKSLINKWFDEIGSDLYDRLSHGDAVPGLKLVEGRTQRSFGNIDEATEYLEFLGLDIDEIQPRSMISPAQAETVLVKAGYKRKQLPDLLDGIVRRSPGKPTMVDESDPRPAVMQSDDVFDDLDEL